MASRTTSPTCFQNLPQMLHPSYENPAEEESHRQRVASADFDSIKVGGAVDNEPAAISLSPSLIYNLSVLQDKVHQVQSLVTLLISTGQVPPEPSSMVMVSSMGTLIQEIIFTASSMMFTCQQMATTVNNTVSQQHFGLSSHNRSSSINNQPIDGPDDRGESSLYPETGVDWITNHQSNVSSMICNTNHQIVNSSSVHQKNMATGSKRSQTLSQANGGSDWSNSSNYDIIELDASELLAKYTHYCQICEKGFKRDANLRMHMRAHGDEYKSSSALSNPLKKRPSIDPDGINIINDDELVNGNPTNKVPRKYSCPHEGCRWNQRHSKFTPLKSMICAKNHYKRSHCPKMYVCKQCNTKQFSVLSDLRTHEKHCGDVKWQCSCGTTFSRKDKLMGHVALFTGHSPIISLTKPTSSGKVEQWSISSMQIGDRQENL